MIGSRSSNDPMVQFSASLQDRMIQASIDVATLSAATEITPTRLQEILDQPGTVRLNEIETIASYFGASLRSFFE